MGFGPMHTAPKYQNEAVIHSLTASGRVGTTATVNKRSRDPTSSLLNRCGTHVPWYDPNVIKAEIKKIH